MTSEGFSAREALTAGYTTAYFTAAGMLLAAHNKPLLRRLKDIGSESCKGIGLLIESRIPGTSKIIVTGPSMPTTVKMSIMGITASM